LHEGEQFSLDWDVAGEATESVPHKILLIVHGLTGGSNMNYVKYFIKVAQLRGYLCVAFNSRGINMPLTTPNPYNPEDLGELRHAIELIRARFPAIPIFAAGCSFGGNMLLRLLGDAQQAHLLQGMVNFSTPFDLDLCVKEMGSLYESFFVNRYKINMINPHLKVLRELERTKGVDFEAVRRSKTLREFHS